MPTAMWCVALTAPVDLSRKTGATRRETRLASLRDQPARAVVRQVDHAALPDRTLEGLGVSGPQPLVRV